ncbi:hypothetical protein [Plastoroseomonas arctica]|uniref:Uncharacterized protein n=1 Tax=Plastoroseomonas arctica TaxID=1509237 RepID=A0AAF1JUS5_9PROT|nr:hypothetical protein [Plastoroseomonas arctica]MBR0653886.1 hypothetical protein [Plastoroseomonas arctica]
MAEAVILTVPESSSADREALRMMLEYVEVECRRIGALAAARHAAQAAASITEAGIAPAPMTLNPLH